MFLLKNLKSRADVFPPAFSCMIKSTAQVQDICGDGRVESCGVEIHYSVSEVHKSVEHGIRRRDESILRLAFDQYKDQDRLPRKKLLQALRELNSPWNDDTLVDEVLEGLGHQAGEPVDLELFRMLVDYPTPLERFVQAMPLSKLLADALLDGTGKEPLAVMASLSPKDVESVTAGFLFGFSMLLSQQVETCRLAMQSTAKNQGRSARTLDQDEDSKFALPPMSCGNVADFHNGLSGRIGACSRTACQRHTVARALVCCWWSYEKQK